MAVRSNSQDVRSDDEDEEDGGAEQKVQSSVVNGEVGADGRSKTTGKENPTARKKEL